MKLKFKTIKQNAKSSFIWRLALYLKTGSIKLHIILSDDNDEPHTHPWNFKSFLIIPYKEIIYDKANTRGSMYKLEFYRGRNRIEYIKGNSYLSRRVNLYSIFSINRKECNEIHRTKLYRVFGIKIPAITIGWYGEKKQLCSFCKPLGYCKENLSKSI